MASLPASSPGRKSVRVGIVDVVSRMPARGLKARALKPNYAAIMPQVVGVWAEQLGHRVEYFTYTGFEDLERHRPRDVDIVFICSFTNAAFLAYSLANLYRSQGIVTVLGGPHARAYRDDALMFFDYVTGFVDRALVEDLLQDFSPQPDGMLLSAAGQPRDLPGVRERWKYICHNLAKTPFWARSVPMLGSLGCPYTCSFCIDGSIAYQPLPYDQLREDLVFLAKTMRKPMVGWHDPNFGVRFDDYMAVIEAAAPPGTFGFLCESTLSLLTEPHLRQMQRNGFHQLVVGVESWYDYNNKARQGNRTGETKVKEVAEQANLITSYIPHLQTNFIFGLDSDVGREPFELTKRFIDLAPAVVPAYSLFTSFGSSAELDVQLQREGRVLPVPFPFLAHSNTNTLPRNYTYPELLDHMADLTLYSFLPSVVLRRFRANCHSLGSVHRWTQLVRSKGLLRKGRYAHYQSLRRRLDRDPELAAFYRGESRRVPAYFRNRVADTMGSYYELLPTKVWDNLEKGSQSSVDLPAMAP